MKTISRLRYFLYLSILIVGCTTGKNALQKGNYDASVSKAVDRLKNSPKNSEALQVLSEAYDLALKNHLRQINEAKFSADVLRWEYILSNYQQLNQLADEISSCSSCLNVANPQRFVAEVADAQLKAAEARYELGTRLMAENKRIAARKAYTHFEKAQALYPNFKDVKTQLDQAYWAAVIRVVVEPVQLSQINYQLNQKYFQQQIDQFIGNYKRNKFVLFYDQETAAKQKIVPDQVMRLRFDDFIVGQTYVKERVEKMRRDSIIIGQTRVNKPIYGTVKATFSMFDKQILSSGQLSLTIAEWQTNTIVKQQKLAGTYVWEDSWAAYKGDERALNDKQLNMMRKRELLPPSPDALFAAFTKPIYSQLVDEVNYFYSQY